MFVIIGLGNPGQKYKETWHNMGFLALDEIQSSIEGFSDWTENKKFQAKISEGRINGKKIVLVKPQTYMNESGKAVKSLIANRKLRIADLIIVHDDIDLPLGEIKIAKARGSAGHKGVESIIKDLKTKNFIRIRIGVSSAKKPADAENFVLKKFSKEEKKIIEEVTKKAVEAIEMVATEDLQTAMTKFNK